MLMSFLSYIEPITSPYRYCPKDATVRKMKINLLHFDVIVWKTLCVPMEFPIKFDTVKSEWSIVYESMSKFVKILVRNIFYENR